MSAGHGAAAAVLRREAELLARQARELDAQGRGSLEQRVILDARSVHARAAALELINAETVLLLAPDRERALRELLTAAAAVAETAIMEPNDEVALQRAIAQARRLA